MKNVLEWLEASAAKNPQKPAFIGDKEITFEQVMTWAKTIGKSTEEIVRYFLSSGAAAEQGYKACVSQTKLGKRYGKKKLESACERMLAFTSSPSIRTIATLLKNSREPEKSSEETESGSKYGITRGAAYWKKGGGGNVE